MAYLYPGMDMRWQDAKPLYTYKAKINSDSGWESKGVTLPALEAYDAIWDQLGRDEALADSLHAKDPTIRTPDDVRKLIDVYLLQHYALNVVRRWYSGSFTDCETYLVKAALIANMGESSHRWLEEVFTHGGWYGPVGGGFQDVVTNHFTREGYVNDGAYGYSIAGIKACDNIAQILDRYPDPVWKARCDLYDETLFPRFRAGFDGYLDLRVAGVFVPHFGDCGSPGGASDTDENVVALIPDVYRHGYLHWPTDRLAWELARVGKVEWDHGLFDEDLWPSIEAQAKRAGPPPPLQSRVLDDTGFALLESRYGEPDMRDRAGLALRYGYGYRTHEHSDNLNVQFYAKGLCMVPELGYPNWTHPLGQTAATYHHVTGMIDHIGRQYGGIDAEGNPTHGATGKGTLETFANAPEAAFADVSAQPTALNTTVYRRGVALLDAPGKNSYVFDVLRLKGGTTRTYTFHGPIHEGFGSNLQFGDKGEAMDNLLETQRAKSDGDVTATWKVKDTPLSFRLHLLGQPGRQYTTSRFGKVDSPPIRFLFAEDRQAGGQSEFIALWEPYEGEPFIEKIERLKVTGGQEPEGFAPVALRVTLAGGQTDTLLYSYDATSLHRVGDIEFRGSFGYLSEKEGKLRAMHLVGGDQLLLNGEGIRAEAPGHTAKVVGADIENHRFTLDTTLPADGSLDGRQMRVRAGGVHQVSYRIARVLPPGNVVEVDLPTRIFQSKIESIDAEAGTITCEVPPTIQPSTYKMPRGFYDGALLTDESLRARYRVLSVDDKTIQVRPILASDFTAEDAFGRRMVYLYDFGEGDEITIDGSVFVRKGDDGTWETMSTSDYELVLPECCYQVPLTSLERGQGRITSGSR